MLYKNSRSVALAEPGLMAGWLAGWRNGWLAGEMVGWLAKWLAGWLAGEMQVNFNFLKFIVDQVFKLFVAFNTVTTLLEQYECI